MPTLFFCEYSNTIRQAPENKLIAHYDINKMCWLCEPDLSADKDLCVKVFLELMNFESKYELNGKQLLEKLTGQDIVGLLPVDGIESIAPYILGKAIRVGVKGDRFGDFYFADDVKNVVGEVGYKQILEYYDVKEFKKASVYTY